MNKWDSIEDEIARVLESTPVQTRQSPEELWSKIEKELPKKRRRKILWLPLFGLLLLLVSIVAWGYLTTIDHSPVKADFKKELQNELSLFSKTEERTSPGSFQYNSDLIPRVISESASPKKDKYLPIAGFENPVSTEPTHNETPERIPAIENQVNLPFTTQTVQEVAARDEEPTGIKTLLNQSHSTSNNLISSEIEADFTPSADNAINQNYGITDTHSPDSPENLKPGAKEPNPAVDDLNEIETELPFSDDFYAEKNTVREILIKEPYEEAESEGDMKKEQVDNSYVGIRYSPQMVFAKSLPYTNYPLQLGHGLEIYYSKASEKFYLKSGFQWNQLKYGFEYRREEEVPFIYQDVLLRVVDNLDGTYDPDFGDTTVNSIRTYDVFHNNYYHTIGIYLEVGKTWELGSTQIAAGLKLGGKYIYRQSARYTREDYSYSELITDSKGMKSLVVSPGITLNWIVPLDSNWSLSAGTSGSMIPKSAWRLKDQKNLWIQSVALGLSRNL